MTGRIFNVLIGAWLVVSAFTWPHTPVQRGYTIVAGLLTIVLTFLSSFFRQARYLTAAVAGGLLLLAVFNAPWGGSTFWHNGICAIAIAVAALMSGDPGALRRERELYGRV